MKKATKQHRVNNTKKSKKIVTKRKVLTADIKKEMSKISKHKYRQLSTSNIYTTDFRRNFQHKFQYKLERYANKILSVVLVSTKFVSFRFRISEKTWTGKFRFAYIRGQNAVKTGLLKITPEYADKINKNINKINKSYKKEMEKLAKLSTKKFNYDDEEILDYLLSNRLIVTKKTYNYADQDYIKIEQDKLKENIDILYNDFKNGISNGISNVKSKEEKYIAIAGGGPTALVLAHKILEIDPDMNIIIYEKRDKYVRKQNILVPYRNQLGVAVRDIIDKDKFCIVKRPSNDLEGKCIKPNKKGLTNTHATNLSHISLPIKDLENGFKEYLKDKVTFIKKEINSIDDVDNRCHVIFGCDGSKSSVRTNILKSKEITDDYESYGLILNHTAKNNDKHIIDAFQKTKNFKEFNGTKRLTDNYDLGQNRYRFFRGPDENFYIGLQLTYDEYKESEKAKKYSELPKATKKIFENYFQLLDVKPHKGLENAVVSSFKIKHTYYDKYADIINGKGVYIIGDAVSQAHYFTASGLSRAYAIIGNLNYINLEQLNTVKSAQDYNMFVQTIINDYYDSTRNGYLRSDTSDRLCRHLTKEDWEDIKARLSETYEIRNLRNIKKNYKADNENKVLKLNWFDDKEELCKLFSQFIIDNYPHKGTKKRAIKSHRTTIGF
jgi:hypothetical protein